MYQWTEGQIASVVPESGETGWVELSLQRRSSGIGINAFQRGILQSAFSLGWTSYSEIIVFYDECPEAVWIESVSRTLLICSG